MDELTAHALQVVLKDTRMQEQKRLTSAPFFGAGRHWYVHCQSVLAIQA